MGLFSSFRQREGQRLRVRCHSEIEGWDERGTEDLVLEEGASWPAEELTGENNQRLKFIRYQWETKHRQVFMQILSRWIHLLMEKTAVQE